MPLTLIAGIYGMNFAYMPELDGSGMVRAAVDVCAWRKHGGLVCKTGLV